MKNCPKCGCSLEHEEPKEFSPEQGFDDDEEISAKDDILKELMEQLQESLSSKLKPKE